ncbi:MAG: response regulator [Pyrinomonadaceae bacterium]|nr:response regulator [Pyrinomonadaceae bacterium]MCX7639786.1 response regulator [Pyrinomonadaceae bacterium]MDW8304369.1 response regulator [Acidobacteriota bacterium]
MSKKLLLADDSVTIQKVVNLTFADEGIEVLTASDGNTAIEMLMIYKPDIVIADVNMPGLNGYQLCEKIKTDERLKNIPVILLVGSFEPFNEEEARRVGADDFLTKPFQSIRQLVNKVSSLLESSAVNGQELKQEELADDEVNLASVAEDETIKAESPSDYVSSEVTYEEKTERELAVTAPLSSEEIREMAVQQEPQIAEGSYAGEIEESAKVIEKTAEEVAEESEILESKDYTSSEISSEEPLQKLESSVEIPSPEKIALLELDEDEILELPSLSPSSSVESYTEADRYQERPPESTTSQVVILPPEVIDAIAQKIVEKFVEKTIKEIAWEVVPQQAELIIKKMVEEKLKKQN